MIRFDTMSKRDLTQFIQRQADAFSAMQAVERAMPALAPPVETATVEEPAP